MRDRGNRARLALELLPEAVEKISAGATKWQKDGNLLRFRSAAGAPQFSPARKRWVYEHTTTPSGAPQARHISHTYAQNMIVVVDAVRAIWQNILPPLPEGDSGDNASERDDDERRSKQISPRARASSAVACGGRVQKKLRPVGVHGFADTSHDSGICDDLEIIVAKQMEVTMPLVDGKK